MTETEKEFLVAAYSTTVRNRLPYHSLLKGMDIGHRLDLRNREVEDIVSALAADKMIIRLEPLAELDFKISKDGFKYLKQNGFVQN